MIEHVYRRAAAARSISSRDRRHRRRADSSTPCEAFGGDARDDVAARIRAEPTALRKSPQRSPPRLIVNVQGDEPLSSRR